MQESKNEREREHTLTFQMQHNCSLQNAVRCSIFSRINPFIHSEFYDQFSPINYSSLITTGLEIPSFRTFICPINNFRQLCIKHWLKLWSSEYMCMPPITHSSSFVHRPGAHAVCSLRHLDRLHCFQPQTFMILTTAHLYCIQWSIGIITNSDWSCTRGTIHNKIYLIRPGCLRPSVALQCRIMA